MEVLSTAAATTTVQSSSSSVISSDYETFLHMLTVQMKNQDPLNPVDSSDYAVQLATFSGVEQQVQTNDLLRAMTAQMGLGGIADLASWVGKEVRVEAAASYFGDPITLAPPAIQGADSAVIVVRNAAGVEVQRLDAPMDGQQLVWSGFDSDGYPLAIGQYSFSIEGISDGLTVSASPVGTYQQVYEVRLDAGVSTLVLTGGVEVPASLVTGLREAY